MVPLKMITRLMIIQPVAMRVEKMLLDCFSRWIEMSTYPHLDWLDSLTVTLSVSEPRRVRVCRIGGDQ